MESKRTTPSQEVLLPFELRRVLIGWAMDQTDEQLLSYLHFLIKKIPVEQVYVQHVVPDLLPVNHFPDVEQFSLWNGPELRREVLAGLEKQIASTLEGEGKAKWKCQVSSGDPLEELLEQSISLEIGCLLLGQRVSSVQHRVLSKNLVRKSSADVLLIPEQVRPTLSGLLVPFDFSKNASRALKKAIQIHQRLDSSARLTVLYIYPFPEVNLSKINQTRRAYQAIVERNLRLNFEATLEAIAPDYQEVIDLVLVAKNKATIAETILHQAEQEQCDLLILGAKGHSMVHRLLIGSVAEGLIDQATSTPIMIVR